MRKMQMPSRYLHRCLDCFVSHVYGRSPLKFLSQALQHRRGGFRRVLLHQECLPLFVLRHVAALELSQPQHTLRDQSDRSQVWL